MDRAQSLATRIGIDVRDIGLLAEALVHSSYPNEHAADLVRSNERLEFLGDAVLSLVFSEAFFRRHSDEDEGVLTTRRASIVSTRGLARLAQRIDLGDYLLLGQGAHRAGERRRPSVLAAALEAVAGAIYLDRGIEVVRDWLLQLAAPELDASPALVSLKAPKSRLQEVAYARVGRAPVYRIVSAEGPEHRKRYVVDAIVGGAVMGRGVGHSRRDAETAAAAAALDALVPAAGAAAGDALEPEPPFEPPAVPPVEIADEAQPTPRARGRSRGRAE
ncbi:MAG TPA: ribonuclease III [Candidatus Limnocylindrales bacterium]|nr:ribonuclease III [Candidatus Limnocylindrales bacterium]